MYRRREGSGHGGELGDSSSNRPLTGSPLKLAVENTDPLPAPPPPRNNDADATPPSSPPTPWNNDGRMGGWVIDGSLGGMGDRWVTCPSLFQGEGVAHHCSGGWGDSPSLFQGEGVAIQVMTRPSALRETPAQD